MFFFNYNRINMGISNPLVVDRMNALFGVERADGLRHQVSGLVPEERESVIIEAISEALKEKGGLYVLPFRFRNASGTRTKHHLIFVSKHIRGYEIMKDIMARESSAPVQGVPSFEYNPGVRDQGLLFDLSRPLDTLGQALLERFTGQTLTMKQIYEHHHVGTRFVKKNYKDVLAQLERDGAIITTPSGVQRRANSFADHVRVTFP